MALLPRLFPFWALAALVGCASVPQAPSPMMNAMDMTMGQPTIARTNDLILVTMEDQVHDQLAQGQSVKRETQLPPRYAGFLALVSKRYGVRRVADWPLSSLGIRCLVFKVANPAMREEVVAALNAEPMVETAQSLQFFRTLSVSTYDDPYSSMQHSLASLQISQSHQWATGAGVEVAIIDTGIDYQHPELNEQIVGVKNFVDRKPGAADVHGTAVAGVIAAAANNGEGMVGVAPDAKLLALKACWPDGGNDHAFCSSFTLAKAMNFAIERGVDIINLSLAGPPDTLLTRLVRRAQAQDILVIGAVDSRQQAQFPTSISGVVAATMATPERSPSRGDGPQYVPAPGAQVLSTLPGEDYDYYSGSSVAAAHVTGVAALIRQRKPHLPAGIIAELLRKSVEPASGSLSGCRALAAVITGIDCPNSVGVP